MNMRKHYIMGMVLVVFLLIVVLVALFQFGIIGRKTYDHVYIIGIDGAGNYYKDIIAPFFQKTFNQRNVTYQMSVEPPSISAENWGSMIYGVSPSFHGLTNSIVTEKRFAGTLESVFSKVHKKYPDANIASIVGWSPINYGIIDGFDGLYLYPNEVLKQSLTNQEVVNAVKAYIGNYEPKLMFIQFDDVDHAGHTYGWGSNKY